jgi:hypothetical protein
MCLKKMDEQKNLSLTVYNLETPSWLLCVFRSPIQTTAHLVPVPSHENNQSVSICPTAAGCQFSIASTPDIMKSTSDVASAASHHRCTGE